MSDLGTIRLELEQLKEWAHDDKERLDALERGKVKIRDDDPDEGRDDEDGNFIPMNICPCGKRMTKLDDGRYRCDSPMCAEMGKQRFRIAHLEKKVEAMDGTISNIVMRKFEKAPPAKEPHVFEKHYSGDNSRAFWEAINNIKNAQMHDMLYSKGVELQNLEGELIRDLNERIKMGKSRDHHDKEEWEE